MIFADSGKRGVFFSGPDSKGKCIVQLGAMRTKVDLKKLRLDENQQIESNRSKKKSRGAVSRGGVESRATRRVSRELDIRGCTCDEGIYELDSFIDNAVLGGISVVTVIHGVGTGVLKNAVRAHLRSHPSVKSSRRGMFGEGEDGVTIVELK